MLPFQLLGRFLLVFYCECNLFGMTISIKNALKLMGMKYMRSTSGTAKVASDQRLHSGIRLDNCPHPDSPFSNEQTDRQALGPITTHRS
ncbi:uncharacterized protein EV422DRAFT_161993 [Fimicolochytrium jonesii]|uniref:uncharacterized protein n=1 Tax=Fimicolochytrium jonesii TaxID=1396493 RepID=UPI0022FE6E80|nr:uncharacterized protein EV422DRAFT_161993 [Fimicolochytrium jonesii]KAI8818685.1 hypothetical protein EV422DRAFT_161993 [Fimicolochytrium jonesii]